MATSQSSSVPNLPSVSTSLSLSNQIAGALSSSSGPSQTSGASPSARGRNMSYSQGSGRMLCPVTGCPEASISSSRHFRNFASIRNHLNDHCTGQLSGALPADYLNHHGFTQCSVCDKIISKVYHGTCPRCRPSARIRDQMNSIRSRVTTQSSNNPTPQPTPSAQQTKVHPTLATVHKQYVRTIRNIPVSVRRQWALCFTRAVAQAVWLNNETAWTELQMLAKCTLCSPPRGGKSHKSQRLAWTRGRLSRWLNGERAELWHDIPKYK